MSINEYETPGLVVASRGILGLFGLVMGTWLGLESVDGPASALAGLVGGIAGLGIGAGISMHFVETNKPV